MPALLTSASSPPPPSMSRMISMQRTTLSRSDRSRRMCVRSRLHGHTPGGGVRDTVITRQPSLWKRIAIAWPMPRLAPVTIAVRRTVIVASWSARSSPALCEPLFADHVRRVVQRLREAGEHLVDLALADDQGGAERDDVPRHVAQNH